MTELKFDKATKARSNYWNGAFQTKHDLIAMVCAVWGDKELDRNEQAIYDILVSYNLTKISDEYKAHYDSLNK